MIAGALLALLLSAGAPAPASHFLFGGPGVDWVLLNGDGEVVSRHRRLGGVAPLDAAVSRDGQRWAIATVDEAGRPMMLLQRGLDDGAPRRIVGKGDVLDGLAFSQDGAWVYFSANDFSQPHFAPQPMLYAQVYRVRFDRGEPERLTLSAGCHMWPRPDTGTRVMVSHSTCRGGRSLDLLNSATRLEQVVLPPGSLVGETAPHPDGHKLFLSIAVPAGNELRVLDRRSGSSALWTTTPLNSARSRPQWDAAGEHVFFQNDARVWAVGASGELRELCNLRSAE